MEAKRNLPPCQSMVPPSTLPMLAPNSFGVWKNPIFINHDNQFGAKNSYKETQHSSTHHDEKTHAQLGKNQLDPSMDPRKLKRIISNRASARRSRLKKLQYVTEMEKKVKSLEVEIAVLHPQVVVYKKKQQLLQMEQKMLNEEISTRTSKTLLNTEIEENKEQVNRLRRLHLTQQRENMEEAQVLLPIASTNMDLMCSNQGDSGEQIYEWRQQVAWRN